jgi:hypothetical protein
MPGSLGISGGGSARLAGRLGGAMSGSFGRYRGNFARSGRSTGTGSEIAYAERRRTVEVTGIIPGCYAEQASKPASTR